MAILFDKMTLIYVIMLCLCGIIGEFGYLYYIKKNKANLMLDNQKPQKVSRVDQFKRRFNESKLLKAYKKSLQEQMNMAFYEKETVSSVLDRQKTLAIVTIIVVPVSFIFFPLPLVLIEAVALVLALTLTNIDLYRIVDKKNKDFDKELPTFLSKVILTIGVGMNLENSLMYGTRSINNPLVKREFENLIVSIRLHPDNIPEAFVLLRQRFPKSRECEKFSNIVVSGLKNGNKMSDILDEEMRRVSDLQIKELKKSQEQKSNIAMAMMIITVFVPALLLVLIPLMSSGGIS